MFNMVRVLMLAPYTLSNKKFLQGKIYFIEKRIAEHLVLNNVAKIVYSILDGFENKKINY